MRKLKRDRVVILCVVFNYGQFVGLRVYNIDKQCKHEKDKFQDIFKNELYLYDIWGLSDEGKSYLYKYKKLENIPILSSCVVTQDWHCSKDFKGYRDLPQIDIGTGFYSNISNNVIAFEFPKTSEEPIYYLVNYVNFETEVVTEGRLYTKRAYNLKITNITHRKDNVVPLFGHFIIANSVDKISKGKNNGVNILKQMARVEESERVKEYSRRVDLMIKDSYTDSDIEDFENKSKEREFIRDRYIKGGEFYLELLNKNGLNSVIQGKKSINEVSYFIDTKKLLEEFDSLKQAPCLSLKCNSLIKKIQKETDFDLDNFLLYDIIIDEKIKIISKIFYENSGKLFKKDICASCFTMLNIYGLTTFLERKNILGFSINNENIFDIIYIDVTDKGLFTLENLKVSTHEYVHYLSKNKKTNSSGLNTVSKNKYKQGLRILNEGITELLSIYLLVENLKNNINKDIELKYNSSVIKYIDYQSKLNPYLKDFNTLYPEIYDFIKMDGKGDSRILDHYRYNVYLVCYLMSKIGVQKMINFYFTNDVKGFNSYCMSVFGNIEWLNFLGELSKYPLSLSLNDYRNIKQYLVNIGVVI